MTCAVCGAVLPPGAMFCGECGASASVRRIDVPDPETTPAPRAREDSPPSEQPAVAPEPAAGPADGLPPAAAAAPEPAAATERFVLQFSTGESVTVHGTGIIGRYPVAEPGEAVDQLVPIVDHGKSVSKSHLSFGQENGAFWVSDRFSGNGTSVREPDAAPRRCEPGKRYHVSRGTRVDIGEQFFVVS